LWAAVRVKRRAGLVDVALPFEIATRKTVKAREKLS
jgi:hypothetical protein